MIRKPLKALEGWGRPKQAPSKHFCRSAKFGLQSNEFKKADFNVVVTLIMPPWITAAAPVYSLPPAQLFVNKVSTESFSNSDQIRDLCNRNPKVVEGMRWWTKRDKREIRHMSCGCDLENGREGQSLLLLLLLWFSYGMGWGNAQNVQKFQHPRLFIFWGGSPTLCNSNPGRDAVVQSPDLPSMRSCLTAGKGTLRFIFSIIAVMIFIKIITITVSLQVALRPQTLG